MASFIWSGCLREKKLSMEDILNASLAGGVVIGTTADLIMDPGVSIAVGFVGGSVATLGFAKITPFLSKKVGLYDTCGVNNLHGMPGIIGATIGAILIGSAPDSYWGD
jgi:ammonium transporter Rh